MIDLEAIKQREKEATQGPWENGYDPCHFDAPEVKGKTFAYYVRDAKDAKFIAHARTDIPALIAEVERLRELTEWHPMETAPRDGTEFLGYGIGPVDGQDVLVFEVMEWTDGQFWPYWVTPFQWQPIKPPPAPATPEGTEKPQTAQELYKKLDDMGAIGMLADAPEYEGRAPEVGA